MSKSNFPEWKFKGNFELYAPPGCDHLNDLQLSQKWGANYYDRMCPDKNRFLNKRKVLDFDAFIKWALKHTPGARVHVSGGEPLLRPDIEDQIEKVVQAGFITTVFTNGMLIDKCPRLHKLPLNWIVAHHRQNNFTKWRSNLNLIWKRRFYITRVLSTPWEEKHKEKIRKLYAGLPFYFSYANRQKDLNFPPNPDDLGCIASGVLHLIVPDGRVYRCNDDLTPPIGNTLTGEYWPKLAMESDGHARQCVQAGICPAYLSALLTK